MIEERGFGFSGTVVEKSPLSLVAALWSAALPIILFHNEPAVAQTPRLRVLHNFTGQAWPTAPLVEGADGNFYGVTPCGPGTSSRGQVFKVTPDGVFATLVAFNGDNGQSPNGLVLGNDGNFYGTTDAGGSSGLGTVFRMMPDGRLTTLAVFNGANGLHPEGPLVQYRDGEFYGTTVTGTNYHGTVFKVTMEGVLTTLLSFPASYGSFPAGLTLSGNSSFYGTTYNGNSGQGTVFHVTRRGELTTLAALDGMDAAYATGLTQGQDGKLYGTTFKGGDSRAGTVFRVTRHGKLKTLVNFNWTNGALPAGLLTLGPDKNFYGTTIYGGVFEGTVFKMTPDGTLTTLAQFASRSSGVRPYGGVTFGANGSLCGTAITGGSGDSGIIFRVDLPPCIISQPDHRYHGAGSTATFTVAAAGTKPFSYQWLKNGRKMVDGGDVSGANSQTLVLANVKTNDVGDFAVVVTNPWGSVTSGAAPLTLLERGHSAVAWLRVEISGPSFKAGESIASSLTGTPGTQVRLAFEGFPNSQYVVQYATNLANSPWFALSTNSASADGTWMVMDRVADSQQRFYRVVSLPAP